MHKAWKLIEDSTSIVLVTHINPDADTICSALALYPILKQMSKKVTLFNQEKELPLKYDFLPNYKKFRSHLPSHYDLVIALDSGDMKRLGVEKFDAKIINIDHHKSNTNFGDINIVDSTKPSCTLVVYDFLQSANIHDRRDVATCIYTGLVSDSDFFSYRGVDEQTFLTASSLVRAGANPKLISNNLKERDSLAKIRLTALFLDTIELKKDATIAVGTVSFKDFKKSGATKSDSEHLINILISLATVRLAIFMREQEDGKFKFSLRSKGDLDVSSVAISFGGGGHKNASGFSADTDIVDEIISKVSIKNV